VIILGNEKVSALHRVYALTELTVFLTIFSVQVTKVGSGSGWKRNRLEAEAVGSGSNSELVEAEAEAVNHLFHLLEAEAEAEVIFFNLLEAEAEAIT